MWFFEVENGVGVWVRWCGFGVWILCVSLWGGGGFRWVGIVEGFIVLRWFLFIFGFGVFFV